MPPVTDSRFKSFPARAIRAIILPLASVLISWPAIISLVLKSEVDISMSLPASRINELVFPLLAVRVMLFSAIILPALIEVAALIATLLSALRFPALTPNLMADNSILFPAVPSRSCTDFAEIMVSSVEMVWPITALPLFAVILILLP